LGEARALAPREGGDLVPAVVDRRAVLTAHSRHRGVDLLRRELEICRRPPIELLGIAADGGVTLSTDGAENLGHDRPHRLNRFGRALDRLLEIFAHGVLPGACLIEENGPGAAS